MAVVDGPMYENFTLHFDEDTVFDMDDTYDPSDATATSLYGVPFVIGYTYSTTHAGIWLYQNPPWRRAAWASQSAGGAVYVLSFERFDALQLTLNSTRCPGSFRFECVLSALFVRAVRAACTH